MSHILYSNILSSSSSIAQRVMGNISPHCKMHAQILKRNIEYNVIIFPIPPCFLDKSRESRVLLMHQCVLFLTQGDYG